MSQRRPNTSIAQEFDALRALRLASFTKKCEAVLKVSLNLKDRGQGWVGRADPNRGLGLGLDNYMYYIILHSKPSPLFDRIV